MLRTRSGIIAVGILVLVAGCSHSHTTKPTGSPEAMALVGKLGQPNTPPADVSGTFIFETTQPHEARLSEMYFMSGSASDIAHEPAGDYRRVERYEQKVQKDRFRVIWTSEEIGKKREQRVAAWDGRHGVIYSVFYGFATQTTNVAEVRSSAHPADATAFSFGMPFPRFYGQVTTRHETLNGEQCLVVRDSFSGIYRDCYFAENDGYAPRRITQRSQKPNGPATRPTGEIKGTIEIESGRWPFKHREIRPYALPAGAMDGMDWCYELGDSDTVILKTIRRPDGQWMVTESETTYPFERRTVHFRVENLDFAPIPADAFRITVPKNVRWQ